MAMLVNSIPVDVVGGAYDIAANYLKRTGCIPPEVDVHPPLFDSIVRDFRAGNMNKLRLANRAIARFERANRVMAIAS
jgi:hypothetical protein